jgi:hypothetical protein
MYSSTDSINSGGLTWQHHFSSSLVNASNYGTTNVVVGEPMQYGIDFYYTW